MNNLTLRGAKISAAAMALLMTGCGALEKQLEDGGAMVFVFTTHHASPEQGVFPDRGGEDLPRVFTNDQGWTITLLEAYVTMASVTVTACNDSEFDLNMFWGPCPEDFKDEDLATLTVAGKQLNDGDYCGLRVTYSPYQTPTVDDGESDTRHEVPASTSVDGNTIYMRGGARLGDGEFIQFELEFKDDIVVDLDLNNLRGEGEPFTVAHREPFAKELLVSKTYDRFFDGVDFSSYDKKELESRLGNILREQTQVSEGMLVNPAPTLTDPESEE